MQLRRKRYVPVGGASFYIKFYNRYSHFPYYHILDISYVINVVRNVSQFFQMIEADDYFIN